jgi:hypothetical protein
MLERMMDLIHAGGGLALKLALGIAIFITKALCISLTGHLYLSLEESKNSPLVLMCLILAATGTVYLLII